MKIIVKILKISVIVEIWGVNLFGKEHADSKKYNKVFGWKHHFKKC